jgi:predicted enzyme related to lactoylglutathione lyase
MANVLGVGGVFFKSHDPKALRAWYAKWLKMEGGWDTGLFFKPAQMPPGGYTVWSAFDAKTDYFEPSNQSFMLNLVVDDLDAMLAQIRPSGATVSAKIDESEYGRFAWFIDPDGNKVELWTPPSA